MDPMTMMMLASAAIKGMKGAKDAKQTGGSPIGGFLSGAFDGASGSTGSPFASMFGASRPSIGSGGGGFRMPRTEFPQFGPM